MKKLFDEIPCLENENIILKKLEDAGWEALLEMTDSEVVYRYLPTSLPEKKSRDMHLMLKDFYGSSLRKKTSLILGIYLKKDMSFCGLAEFYGYKDETHKTCVGYRLLEEYWGKGIATQAVALMVDYLHNETDIEIITASTMIENQASAHVLEHNDFIMISRAVPEDWGYPEPTIADKWVR